MGWILRAVAAGLVSFATPRLLIAVGVPLDVWLVKAGQMIGASWLTSDTALWLVTGLLGFILFGAESKWHPAQKLWERVGRLKEEPAVASGHVDSAHSEDGLDVTFDPSSCLRRGALADAVDILVYNGTPIKVTRVGVYLVRIDTPNGPWDHVFGDEPLGTRRGRPKFDLRRSEQKFVKALIISKVGNPGYLVNYARFDVPPPLEYGDYLLTFRVVCNELRSTDLRLWVKKAGSSGAIVEVAQ